MMFKCMFCGEVFDSRDEVIAHMKEYHWDEYSKYVEEHVDPVKYAAENYYYELYDFIMEKLWDEVLEDLEPHYFEDFALDNIEEIDVENVGDEDED